MSFFGVVGTVLLVLLVVAVLAGGAIWLLSNMDFSK